MALLYAYNFDEASGNILDLSGNGRGTTLTGSLARTASGAGHTDKGMAQTTTSLDSAGPSITGLQTANYTVMAWVKRTTNALDGWICELKASGSGDRGILFLSGAVQARTRNSAGTVVNVSTTQPTAGTWYHVAGSYDGTKVHLYVNGTEIGTGTNLTAPIKTTSATSHLIDSLGSETIIDDVRYYDTALTASQIATLMSTPVDVIATGQPIFTFEEGTPDAAITATGDYLAVSGTVTYGTAARYGSLALRSVNGGYIQVAAPASIHSGVFFVKCISSVAGSARIATFTDSATTFHGMIRMHTSGVFDICDNTTTRQALSTYTWSTGVWYRVEYQLTGTGTSRFIATKIYLDESPEAPVWDSGAVAVTAGSSNVTARVRLGAQGMTTGEVITDHVRLYDSLLWPGPYRTRQAAFGTPL